MRRIALAAGLLCFGAVPSGQGPVATFTFVERPQVVNCASRPCFRLTLNAEDAAGRAVPAASSQGFEVIENGTPHTPFSVTFQDGDGVAVGGAPRAYFMVLFDTSGSMNYALAGGQTRFDAAKAALQRSLSGFRPGSTLVAVAPFDSRNVRARIQSAQFQDTLAGIREQLDGIDRPVGTANTALYSAVSEALTVLSRFRDGGASVMLVVFTDGKNDIRPPPTDDPGLLGADGLEAVTRAVAEHNIQIRTIGFGDPTQPDFDERALQAIAWPGPANYRRAANETDFEELFAGARQSLTNRIQLTIPWVKQSLSELSAQSLVFSVRQTLPNGQTVRSDEFTWTAPAFGVPSFNDRLREGEESTRFAEWLATSNLDTGLDPLVVRLLILAGCGLAIGVLWFGIPRIIWPERYAPDLAATLPPGTRGTMRYQPGTGQSRSGTKPPRITVPHSPRGSSGGSSGRAKPGPVTPPIAPRPGHASRRQSDATVRDPGRLPEDEQ